MLAEPALNVTRLAIIRGVLENLCYSELRLTQSKEGTAASGDRMAPGMASIVISPSRKNMANSLALSLAPSGQCGAASISIPRVSPAEYEHYEESVDLELVDNQHALSTEGFGSARKAGLRRMQDDADRGKSPPRGKHREEIH